MYTTHFKAQAQGILEDLELQRLEMADSMGNFHNQYGDPIYKPPHTIVLIVEISQKGRIMLGNL